MVFRQESDTKFKKNIKVNVLNLAVKRDII